MSAIGNDQSAKEKVVSKKPKTVTPAAMQDLLGHLRGLIASARAQALRAVDVIQVRTCWEIGRHIVEFEQGGASRAGYGARLIPNLAATLTPEFGKGV